MFWCKKQINTLKTLYQLCVVDIENLENEIRILSNKVDALTKDYKIMALDFTKVEDAVTAETTVEKSVEALLSQLTSEVESLKAEIASAPDLATAQAKLDDWAKRLSDNNAAFTAAVVKNSKDFTPSGN